MKTQTRVIDTNGLVWGSFIAHRVGDEWRFLVTIRGTPCVARVKLGGKQVEIAKALTIWDENESFGSYKKQSGEWAKTFLIRCLNSASEKLLSESRVAQ